MKHYPLLDRIENPSDLRALPEEKLPQLCSEIRDLLVTQVSQTGGHLASNLGTVELTLALHRVFESPADSIVWDVGHQSYTHKIITGRRREFATLRQEGGLSGFPKPCESEHDAFIAGHSSTSISVAYAISRANHLKGNPHHAVAVIGDGAYTGGMAYEAMNNAGRSRTNLVIVLNHNDMSISRNVGSFARYLSTIRAKPGYLRFKGNIEFLLDHTPFVGVRLKEALQSSKSALKYLLYHSTFFEELGFAYFGPVDGHDIKALELVLGRAKALGKPALVMVETVKGKGYEFAEKNPLAYHGVSRFDIETGNPDAPACDSFSKVFGHELTKLAKKDSRICAITAAMKDGTGLLEFSSACRSRFFDVGIAEQHAVTFGAGLASKGLLPVFAVYSTFLQRAYDQILHDAALGGQHLVLAVDRAGVVGDDGETHQGIYDVSFLTSIPEVTIFSPSSYEELAAMLKKALYKTSGVAVVRYPRGSDPKLYESGCPDADMAFWPGERGFTAVSYGRVFQNLWQAASGLDGKRPSLLKLGRIWPLPEGALDALMETPRIVFFEEAVQSGSISEHLLLALSRRGWRGTFSAVTLPDAFLAQSKAERILARCGLSAAAIEKRLKEEALKVPLSESAVQDDLDRFYHELN
ncbi:MAG: 1-deoxy-D-xylulose-5-phosphate synthase [Oscillospiraceae bacterium]|jgi:1-deoxy-D-xylulose-5-phosphate synthase|nr:1-deoxy-D-xylulose-5-phosphate synthase [Oscillospiraceae bacterium]